MPYRCDTRCGEGAAAQGGGYNGKIQRRLIAIFVVPLNKRNKEKGTGGEQADRDAGLVGSKGGLTSPAWGAAGSSC